MNNKKKMLLVSLLIVPSLFLVKLVTAQVVLPRISNACESKNGQLYAFNDEFSNQEKCSGKDRRIILIGEQGQVGPRGATGQRGIDGVSGWERRNAKTDNDTIYRKRITAYCTGNKKVIGGGANISNGDDRRTFISQSYPDTNHSWTAGAEETTIDAARSISGNPWTLEAFVICANVN